MIRVVDASIVLKWFVAEQGSAEARALLAEGLPLVAPELLLAEVANAGWKAVRRSGMTAAQLRQAAAELSEGLIDLVSTTELAPAATDLAIRRNHPVYDCFYVALAQREGAPLVTADARLARVFGTDAEIHLL